MNNDFLTREWADNHRRFGSDIDKLVRGIAAKIGAAFDALHRAQFDAPWQRPTRRIRIVGLR